MNPQYRIKATNGAWRAYQKSGVPPSVVDQLKESRKRRAMEIRLNSSKFSALQHYRESHDPQVASFSHSRHAGAAVIAGRRVVPYSPPPPYPPPLPSPPSPPPPSPSPPPPGKMREMMRYLHMPPPPEGYQDPITGQWVPLRRTHHSNTAGQAAGTLGVSATTKSQLESLAKSGDAPGGARMTQKEASVSQMISEALVAA
ncbi:hypothetical protein CYMTET_12426, partial [Cymbomonas tetramitiformis]